ncbi:MAG: type II toxin-antitoxin system RelE/ParE family toxin [Desulfobulbaceae bacterium]
MAHSPRLQECARELRVSCEYFSVARLFRWSQAHRLNHAFQKKTQKTPQQAIHIAEQRKRDYFERRSS